MHALLHSFWPLGLLSSALAVAGLWLQLSRSRGANPAPSDSAAPQELTVDEVRAIRAAARLAAEEQAARSAAAPPGPGGVPQRAKASLGLYAAMQPSSDDPDWVDD